MKGTIIDFEFYHIASTSQAIMVRKKETEERIWLPFNQIAIHKARKVPGEKFPLVTISMSDGFAAFKGLINQESIR